MRQRNWTFLVCTAILSGIMLLAACNLPRKGTPTPSAFDQIGTSAAQTTIARLTQASLPTQPGVTTTPSSTPVPTMPGSDTQGDLATPTATTSQAATVPVASPSPKPPPCDQGKFVKDVTVPDNTEFTPGFPFTKTWRLRNSGTCTWSTGYTLIFDSGEDMDGPTTQALPHSVGPGETIDISVNLVAPNTVGTYKGNWKLRNAANQVFGLGDQNKPFWVQVKVVVAGGIPLDFISQASSAKWYSGVGNNLAVPLTFNGIDEDPNGVAKIKDGALLESGANSGKILFTYPRREDNGYTVGVYPIYTVQPGDRFKARLGFLANLDGSCHAGKVIFGISYREGDTLNPLREWGKTCDRNLMLVDVDLSKLAGRSVQFILTVRADGSWLEDWAIWNSPGIVR